MKFFQINIMFGVVGSDKCNVNVIFSLKCWLKYLCKTVIYFMLWMFSIKCFFDSFYQFPLLLVTILTIRFADDNNILFFVCGGWQLV